MATLHLYPTDDGESHFEDITLQALTEWAKPGANIMFVEGKAGFTDFHNSGRAHVAIILSGRMEMTASDGSKKIVGPGDCMFSEDTTGKGHAANVFADAPFRLAIVTLAS